MKAVIGISGASGAGLGIKLAFALDEICDTHLIVSNGARDVLSFESGISLDNMLLDFKGKIYQNTDLSAQISSGSFMSDVVFITPCSISTLGKIASGISDTLITRVAAVALKQRQRLVLGVREMPFSTLNLEQMAKLSSYGAVIAPPVLGYYADSKSVDEIENFIIGKWLDAANIKNKFYKRWQEI
ncbi:UbiX family flavin prenyltransferase [Campylobacter suis]|uniref:Flavin prenyltransferase UbiX n=1 Tax=Campylobacter suis TaxID=2790657 RepID=A0ABM8Q2K8_9BACT|nr:UbiX family flavin prenyltransferase [Campylobacter suis]CAD7287041.1 putative UbiX-like flavin prenyltransferase [Campylobacter suis]